SKHNTQCSVVAHTSQVKSQSINLQHTNSQISKHSGLLSNLQSGLQHKSALSLCFVCVINRELGRYQQPEKERGESERRRTRRTGTRGRRSRRTRRRKRMRRTRRRRRRRRRKKKENALMRFGPLW